MNTKTIFLIVICVCLIGVASVVGYKFGETKYFNDDCVKKQYYNDAVAFSNSLIDGYNLCYGTPYEKLKEVE
jgi:hypothetical protein